MEWHSSCCSFHFNFSCAGSLAKKKTAPLKPQWRQARGNLTKRLGESRKAGKSAEVMVLWLQGMKI